MNSKTGFPNKGICGRGFQLARTIVFCGLSGVSLCMETTKHADRGYGLFLRGVLQTPPKSVVSLGFFHFVSV